MGNLHKKKPLPSGMPREKQLSRSAQIGIMDTDFYLSGRPFRRRAGSSFRMEDIHMTTDAMKLYAAIQDGVCACGKKHATSVRRLEIGHGAIGGVAEIVRDLGAKKPFILADVNTWQAAGAQVDRILRENGFSTARFVFAQEHPEPDEYAVGSAAMHDDDSCDLVIAVGSGVINDIGKILSRMTKRPYVIVATAPSMDGYASASSSMSRDGLKVSLSTRCADVIVGDLDVLCAAPEKLLISGLGDMLAKYVSICEWRIAHELVGEPYCEAIAQLVRSALAVCMSHADGLLRRESDAVRAVFEGLVVCGAAMEFAGLSRPASGVEHYISHIWDMRALALGAPADTHGIQCAIGTLAALRAYEQIRWITPDRDKALAAVRSFSFAAWSKELRAFLGKGAEAMIRAEDKELKYDAGRHALRLEKILANWDRLCAIMDEELPASAQIEALLEKLGAPKRPSDIGIADGLLPMTFKASKDIRDKYVLSRLAWDLGVLDELADTLR